jgi:hypothetical protein
MSRSNLVIVRAGRKSLHPSWLARTQPRNWDLYICPYEPVPPQDELDVAIGEVVTGPKWTGLRELLHRWDGWREYEYIWLPDDDVFTSQESINQLFDLGKALSLELFAPALHEASFYAHFDTMRNQRCFARRTGFVEIMVPCFSVSALSKLLPTLDLTPTGWGWGLDSLWPYLLNYRNVGVIDAVPVLHTRPVGQFRDAALDQRVRAESDLIMARHGCQQVHATFKIIGADREPVCLKPDALALRLAEGWRYLLDSNPAVLPWVLAAQQPQGGWGDYPIAGTPSCAR